MSRQGSNVVDFVRYRAAREQLDLFDRPARARLVRIRPLTPRQSAHRARMLRHLTATGPSQVAGSAPAPVIA